MRTWYLACSTREVRLARCTEHPKVPDIFPILFYPLLSGGWRLLGKGEVNGQKRAERCGSHLLSKQVTCWFIIVGCAMGRKTLCCQSSACARVSAQCAQGSC